MKDEKRFRDSMNRARGCLHLAIDALAVDKADVAHFASMAAADSFEEAMRAKHGMDFVEDEQVDDQIAKHGNNFFILLFCFLAGFSIGILLYIAIHQ